VLEAMMKLPTVAAAVTTMVILRNMEFLLFEWTLIRRSLQ
jgi:hypothetical protein